MQRSSSPHRVSWLSSWLVSSALVGCTVADREIGDRLEDHEPTPWTSAEACEQQAIPRGPASERAPRIGTWNLLYFPDADEERADDEDATNIPWLACAIGNLDVDILAIQELKITERSKEKQAELIGRLNARTGGDWRIEAASCEPTNVQHPGFLFDASRVTGSDFRELPELSPSARCTNRVSPGFAGYFRIAGGPDFHMIAVHLEAYPEKSSFRSRERSVALMGTIAQQANALIADRDVIFVGDFNTTGCDECDPKISSDEEVERVRDNLILLEPSLTLVDANLSCSKPGGGLMDHFVLTDSLAEGGPLAQVGGICAETSCGRAREWHEEATERLSDHCPVTLELLTSDRD